jgi:CBS domain-containing protein
MTRHESATENAPSGLDDLRTLRDEIRVDLHLASMELRDEWKQLEGKLPDAQAVHRLKEFTKDATDTLAEELRRFRTRLRARRDAGEAERIMTPRPATCAPSETLAQAVTRMWNLDIGWLPVVEGDQLVGIVTDRDACIAACTRGMRMDDLTVASAMSREVWSCTPQNTIDEALGLMRAHKIRRLPVQDEEGRLVGVITLGDIARAPAVEAERRRHHAAAVGMALAEICIPRASLEPLH